MIGNKKILKEIQEERKKIETLRNELQFIKTSLEDTSPKIDISDVYIWEENGLYSIVKLKVENISGKTCRGHGITKDGYESTLIDIFTNKVIYTKCSVELMSSKQWISSNHRSFGCYAYLMPIYKYDNSILAYTDKQVPLYVLQQLYYKLNNVNINDNILKKSFTK